VNSQASTPLLSALQACARRSHAPFYAPGHKRGVGTSEQLIDFWGSGVFAADLPELPELDNLLAPESVIQAAQELAAAAFGAGRTWFLVNGSTCGIMAAILATCGPGEKIALPRNAHQSAIAGLIASGAVPIFLEPEYDPDWDLVHSITPETVAKALEQFPDIKAVLLVYPTYHGVCGDVGAIAERVHDHGIPLLVDEAHGPHFAFHPELPVSALEAGADLTVQSIHKVLSALTQASMLHLQGNRIAPERITQALQLVQSTSPSYLLLASLDAARQQMAVQGEILMTRTLQLADQARESIDQMPGLAVLGSEQPSPGFVSLDRTRLTVRVSGLGWDGFAADEILHQQLGVTAELPSPQHLTFILSLGNTAADIAQLVRAFQVLAQDLPPSQPSLNLGLLRSKQQHGIQLPALSPRDAFFARTETLAIAEAIHHVSAELVCPYPPGIPVLLPGERITREAVDYLLQVRAAGGKITGCSDASLQSLKVVRASFS
jgi:arginine decarboxylase